MTWPLLLLTVFLGLGLRAGTAGRRVHLAAVIVTVLVLGYVYVGLGKVP